MTRLASLPPLANKPSLPAPGIISPVGCVRARATRGGMSSGGWMPFSAKIKEVLMARRQNGSVAPPRVPQHVTRPLAVGRT
jgi:hypothetical protein